MTIQIPGEPEKPLAPLSLYVPDAPGWPEPLDASVAEIARNNPRITHEEEDEGEDWEAMDAREAAYLRAHPGEARRQYNLPKGRPRFILAEGGPYDGTELVCPPSGAQVVLSAAFAPISTDLRGQVIYRLDRRPGGDRMVFAGQPDQTDEAHTDLED